MGTYTKINSNGDISRTDKQNLGGEFSLIDSLFMNGTGSPKIFYKAGLVEFDKISNSTSSTSFCSFEIFKSGILLRLNCQQNMLGYYCGFGEINNIIIEAKESFWPILKGLIKLKVFYGDLFFKLDNNITIKFEFNNYQFKRIKQFFMKKQFMNKLQISISNVEEPQDIYTADNIFELFRNLF